MTELSPDVELTYHGSAHDQAWYRREEIESEPEVYVSATSPILIYPVIR